MKDLSSLAFVLSSPIPLNLRQQLRVCIFNLKNYRDGVSYLRWGEMAETNVGRDPLLNNLFAYCLSNTKVISFQGINI